MSRSAQLTLLVGGLAAAVVTLFVPVQRWLQHTADGKALLSAIPILPFVLLPLVVRPLGFVCLLAELLFAFHPIDAFLMNAQ